MKNRNIHQFAQLAFNDEAIGRLNIFQINAAKARPQMLDRIDEGVRVFRVQFEVDGIDIGKAFEQDGLTLHHRLGGKRPQIAEAQNRRAIGDDGDHIAARGVVIGAVRIVGNGLHRHGNARRIGERQIALCRHGFCRIDFQLARLAACVKAQRFLIGEVFFRIAHASDPLFQKVL